MPNDQARSGQGDDNQKKADFEAFLKRGAVRREEMKEKQAAAKSQRREEATARDQRARQNINVEEIEQERKREELAEWRTEEQKRKAEIEADKKRMLEMEKLLVEKQEKKRGYEAQRKEYMKNLQWASAIDRLKRKRDRGAKEAKLQMMNEADSQAKQEKERILQERRGKDHSLVREAQGNRGEVDIEEERKIEKIDEDIKDRKTKIFAKEQTEKSNFRAEMMRKRSLVKEITDPSLKQRRKDELDREEKQMLQKIRTKYQQQTTSLEIERTQRIDMEHKNAKKARDTVAADERKALEQSRQTTLSQQSQVNSKLAKKRHEAKHLQSEILGMTFEEVAERDEDSKKK